MVTVSNFHFHGVLRLSSETDFFQCLSSKKQEHYMFNFAIRKICIYVEENNCFLNFCELYFFLEALLISQT